ncbi:hypothetical protein CVS40_4120 [Lucilia cuprina]|nr:hypothetical protein CVS40_4120 [Lucilia cuprina]
MNKQQQLLLQQLPQVHNHNQTQSFLSRKVEQQPLEKELQEDNSNHIFRPQIQAESLFTSNTKETNNNKYTTNNSSSS